MGRGGRERERESKGTRPPCSRTYTSQDMKAIFLEEVCYSQVEEYCKLPILHTCCKLCQCFFALEPRPFVCHRQLGRIQVCVVRPCHHYIDVREIALIARSYPVPCGQKAGTRQIYRKKRSLRLSSQSWSSWHGKRGGSRRVWRLGLRST